MRCGLCKHRKHLRNGLWICLVDDRLVYDDYKSCKFFKVGLPRVLKYDVCKLDWEDIPDHYDRLTNG